MRASLAKRVRSDLGQAAIDSSVTKRQRKNDSHDSPDNVADQHTPKHQSSCSLSHDDYTVGWVCALHIEMAAAEAMLDETHKDLPQKQHDSNAYTLGRIGSHNIVIACLPAELYGNTSAAAVAAIMCQTFPSVRMTLMVGIGGGVPGTADVRLGDVVVGTRVLQYDLGKFFTDGFKSTAIPRKAPPGIMSAVAKLQAQHEARASKIASILSEMLLRRPKMQHYATRDQLEDRLFQSDYEHNLQATTCVDCDPSKLRDRQPRANAESKVHYGLIASTNKVMKNGHQRDKLAKEFNILCFEMEAAGLVDNTPTLVVRGICDYADSHKSKEWQSYAAAVAAAYAKEYVDLLPPWETQKRQVSLVLSTTDRQGRQDLLDALKFHDMDTRERTISKAQAKTCEWLLEHEDYIEWLDPMKYQQHHGFLWIKGKPGAGKSTLMKYLCSCTSQNGTDCATISFFFNARGDTLEKSTIGMYRSLLVQLLEAIPDLQTVLDNPKNAAVSKTGSSPSWSVDLLCELFSAAIEQLGQRQVVCFIDALDECDEGEVQRMIRYFEDLGEIAVESSIKLYICFSSRHYPTIVIEYGRAMDLEKQAGHKQDLVKYVEKRLRVGKGKKVEQIQSDILEKAKGIFLWLVLVIDILNKAYKNGAMLGVENRLQEIPEELSNLFKEIITRDSTNMDELLLCIQWILFAKRPLKREEFYFALSSGLGPGLEYLQPWDQELISEDVMNRYVSSCSKGLAELTKSKKSPTVQFIHESVRDFLIQENGLQELWPDYNHFESRGHDRIKQSCYNYLHAKVFDYTVTYSAFLDSNSEEAKQIQQKSSELFPFLEYAVQHVLYHANQAAPNVSQEIFVSQLDLKMWVELSNFCGKFKNHRYRKSANLLYVLAENDLANLLDLVIHKESEMVVLKERFHSPLFAAAVNGHTEMIQMLLQHYARVDPRSIPRFLADEVAGKTPLLWAAKNGDGDMVLLLLNQGADVKATDSQGMTALCFAAQIGHTDMVRLLLQHGAELEAKGFLGCTALSLAASGGHDVTVEALIQLGANLEARDGDQMTPLIHAARAGYSTTIKLLCDHGAKLDSKNELSKTPLSYVIAGQRVKSRHTRPGAESIRLLVERGANIEEKDAYGCSPLSLAVVCDQMNTVLQLIELGADIESRANSGNTPLCYAAQYGSAKVAGLLCARGANFEARGAEGRTPLALAAAHCKDAQTILVLIDRGANLESRDEHGRTPLSLATENTDSSQFVQLLLLHGANANTKDDDGRTPLSWAAEGTHPRSKDIITKLVNDGADMEAQDSMGLTPCFWAAGSPYEGGVIPLLDLGANIEAKDFSGRTPLMRAAELRRAKSVALLVQRGAEVNATDKKGRTALSWAAQNGSLEAVRLLIGAGADLNIADYNGQTPWSFAKARKHFSLRGLLSG